MTRAGMELVIAAAAGLLFGAGLLLSGMADPQVVLGFLDVAALPAGGWNPALALVMIGALATAFPAFFWLKRRGAPLVSAQLSFPTKTAVDGRLLLGAAIFGVGWGLGGICPGPAVAAIAWGDPSWLLFWLGLGGGLWAAGRV